MTQTYGIEAAHIPSTQPEQRPVRYVVLIEAGSSDSRVARLFLTDREQVAMFDAGAPEIRMMTDGLEAARWAEQPEWDAPLAGHSAGERAAAEIYTLAI